MKKLILEEWLSLDGFAVDKDGRLDFFPPSETDKFSDRDQLEFLQTVDTILLGRKTYELFVDFWPTATTDKEIIAERLNTLPKLVFSNTLREGPWGTWRPACRIFSTNPLCCAIGTFRSAGSVTKRRRSERFCASCGMVWVTSKKVLAGSVILGLPGVASGPEPDTAQAIS